LLLSPLNSSSFVIYFNFSGASNTGGGPSDWMVSLWVKICWVREFTVVVLLVHGVSGVGGNSNEVVDMQFVSEVLIEVILEMLKEVHVLLDEVIASHSWEGESLIVKFPCMDRHLWIFTLLLQFLVDLHGFFVVLWVEASREVIKLNVELCLRNIDGWLATSCHFSLNE
jgi:hypothetical protein